MNDQKIVYAAAGGAVGLGGSAALVSSCCAAPWAVALFGTAAAAALARLSFLHPYLLAAAALSIGGLFWLAYRRRPALAGGGYGSIDRQRQALAWCLAVGLVLAMIAARSVAE